MTDNEPAKRGSGRGFLLGTRSIEGAWIAAREDEPDGALAAKLVSPPPPPTDDNKDPTL